MNLDRRLWKPASAVPAPLAANMLSDVLLHGFQVAVLGSGNSSERRTTQHDYRGGSYVLRRLNANPADATSRQHVVAHNACNQLDSRVMSHHSSSGPPPTSAASSQEAAELVAEVEKWDLERRWRLVSRRMVQPMIEHLICRNWAPKPQAVLDTTLTPIFSISSTIQGVPLSWFVEHVAPHMPVVHLERVACRIVLPALVALLTYLHTVASVRHTAIHIRHLFLLCGGSNATPSQRGGAEEAAAAISAPSSRLVAAALFHDADSIPRRLCDVSRADDPPPPHENPSATAWLSREALQASLEATYPAPSSPLGLQEVVVAGHPLTVRRGAAAVVGRHRFFSVGAASLEPRRRPHRRQRAAAMVRLSPPVERPRLLLVARCRRATRRFYCRRCIIWPRTCQPHAQREAREAACSGCERTSGARWSPS